MKNLLIIGVIVVFAALLFSKDGGVILANLSSGITGKQIVEVPRNDQPAGNFTPYFERFSFPAGNRVYTYFWYAPEKPWPEELKFPLVLVLHSDTGRAWAADYLVSDEIATKYPAFVLVPALAPGRLWAKPAKGEMLPSIYALNDTVAIIRNVADLYPVDTSRIYVTGCGDGGAGVFGAARYFPDIFAAGAAMSGEWNPEDGVNMTETPLLVLHSKNDDMAPAEQAKILTEVIRSREGEAWYKEFDYLKTRCAEADMYSDVVWEWLFSQKRSNKTD